MSKKIREYKKHNSFINFKTSQESENLNFKKYLEQILINQDLKLNFVKRYLKLKKKIYQNI